MFIYLGSDHRGFELKAGLKEFLAGQGYQLQDMGAQAKDENDDYVDFAKAVADKVSKAGDLGKGIVICGSGVGVDVVANKVDGVRSVLGFVNDQVFDAREHDDVNVLALPADFIDLEKAKGIVKIFLSTPFSAEEKYKRRLYKIREIENSN